MYNTRYYTLRQNVMEKYNKILSKMCQDLVQQAVHHKLQQKVQQNVQQKARNNYVVHLIKPFVFTKSVECLC